jgi:glycerol-3-phosphate dehydrogenase
MYDIIIIGAGVSGACIARELSRYEFDILVLEKENDVASGTTKANSAIVHAGYDAKPGTMMAEMNVRGNELYENLCRELDVPFQRIGSLVIALNEEEEHKLDELYERGIKNSVPDLKIISAEEVLEMEPHVNPDVTKALYAPTAAITSPYELCIALMENAVANGVEFKRNEKVTSINKYNNTFQLTTEAGNYYQSRVIVNATGLYADEIHNMAGGRGFRIKPRKGEYHLLDKSQGKLVSMVIFQVPTEKGKGILVLPTVHGNLIVGPNATDIEDKTDLSTTYKGLKHIVDKSKTTIKDFILRESITSFAGLRAIPDTPERDFIIEESKQVKNFINVAGICSPGLASSPAIAERVVYLIANLGIVSFIPSRKFNNTRKGIPSIADKNTHDAIKLYEKDNRYANIVCRCEVISEAEIVEAIHRIPEAIDFDGVKRRVRAGMGRCHGGFCLPRVLQILARELNIPPEKITKYGRKSYLLSRKTKEELK